MNSSDTVFPLGSLFFLYLHLLLCFPILSICRPPSLCFERGPGPRPDIGFGSCCKARGCTRDACQTSCRSDYATGFSGICHPPPMAASPSTSTTSPAAAKSGPPAPLAGLTPRRSQKVKQARPAADGPRPLQVSITPYATNGALCHTDFEEGEAAFVMVPEHSGTKANPSVLFQFKDNLLQYLDALHKQDPSTPADVHHLAPRLCFASYLRFFFSPAFVGMRFHWILRRSLCSCIWGPFMGKAIYTGGGAEGPMSALHFLHNYIAWLRLRTPNLRTVDLDLWCEAAVVDVCQVPAQAWTVRHCGKPRRRCRADTSRCRLTPAPAAISMWCCRGTIFLSSKRWTTSNTALVIRCGCRHHPPALPLRGREADLL